MTRVKHATAAKKRRHLRVRKKVSGTSGRPRLCVFRSLNHTYAQVVDDTTSRTIVSASTLDEQVKSDSQGKHKVDAAKLVGTIVAERAIQKGVSQVVFDRGGYRYHGRVKAVVEAAREAGLVV